MLNRTGWLGAVAAVGLPSATTPIASVVGSTPGATARPRIVVLVSKATGFVGGTWFFRLVKRGELTCRSEASKAGEPKTGLTIKREGVCLKYRALVAWQPTGGEEPPDARPAPRRARKIELVGLEGQATLFGGRRRGGKI